MNRFLKIAGLVSIGILLFVLAIAGFIWYKLNHIKDTHDLAIRVDKKVMRLIVKEKIPGIVVGIIQGNEIFIRGYGTTDKEHGTRPDSLTIFEIGSITKTFTAALAQMEVDKGTLSWDNTIEQVLPPAIKVTMHDGTTLKHLVSHTSGFPSIPDTLFSAMKDMCNPYVQLRKEDIYSYLSSEKGKKKPDFRHYDYSNYGMGLLGHILEYKTGKTYPQMLQEEILAPLQMKNTFINIPGGDSSKLASGYDAEGRKTCHWEFGALYGCGAIRSNAADMLRYMRANMYPGQPLHDVFEKTHRQLAKMPVGGVGYAWHLDHINGILMNIKEIIWHNGGTGGFHSYMGFDKEHGIGVVILANQANEDIDKLGVDILLRAKNISLR